MPMIWGLGGGYRFSWAFMYWISRALTVLQSSRSSLATSLIGLAPAAAADVMAEPLGVERVVGQEGQLLLSHGATPPAEDSPDLQVQVDPDVAAGLVPHPPGSAVVPRALDLTTAAAGRFFSLRKNEMTRVPGSPKTPRTTGKRAEAGEAILIEKQARAARSGHELIISVSREPPKLRKALFHAVGSMVRGSFYPLAFKKTQNMIFCF